MVNKIKIFKSKYILLLSLLLFAGCAARPEIKEPVSTEPVEKTTKKQVKMVEEGDGENLYDVNQKIEYYLKKLKVDMTDPEIHYNLASIYLNMRKFRKSHQYIKNSIKYSKNDEDTERYRVFYGRLLLETYNNSKRKDSISYYKMFLELFPDSFYYDEIRGRLEELMYKEAESKNRKEVYEKFIKEFPKSVHLHDIYDRLDELAFEEALKINTISNYQDFIKENPFSNFKDIALDRIDRLRLENVSTIDTIEAYSGFIQKYPGNKYIKDAKKRIEELKFAKVEESENIEKYYEYIKDNPKGIFVSTSLERIDEIQYKIARDSDSIEVIEEFIKKYPKNRFVDRATRRLDVLKYEQVEKKDTVSGYMQFIKENPNSIFKRDAQERLDRLSKEDKITKLCNEAEEEVKNENYEKAIEFYKEALNVDYSSRAHYGVGKLYEKLADEQEDYKKKIEYYYMATTEFKAIAAKDPEYMNIAKVIDDSMGKRSAEQNIMNEARLRKQNLEYPLSVQLITYSKKPVFTFSNIGREKSVSVDMKTEDKKEAIHMEIAPQSEITETLTPGNVILVVKGDKLNKTFSIELFPYFEYGLEAE